MELAKSVVDKMISNDSFSKWLGIEVLEVTEGFCKLQLQIRDDMTNGFKIAHGGISYSLADSALAFASNSYGLQSLSIETSISYIKKITAGDILTATTKEISKSEKFANYNILISNQKDEKVATFTGKVYRTKNEWFSKNKI